MKIILFLGFILMSCFSHSSEIIKINHIVQKEMGLEEIIGIYLKPDRRLDKNSESIKQTISGNEIKPRYLPNETVNIYLHKNDIKEKYLRMRVKKPIKPSHFKNYASFGFGLRNFKKQTTVFGITQKNYTPLMLEVGIYDLLKKNIYLKMRANLLYKATNSEYLVDDKNKLEGSIASGYLAKDSSLGVGLYLQSEPVPTKNKRNISQENKIGYGVNLTYGISEEVFDILKIKMNMNYFKQEKTWPLVVDLNISTPLFENIDVGMGLSKSFLSDEYDVSRINLHLQYLF